MKHKKSSCGLDRCTLCKLCETAWKPATAVHRKNLYFTRGEQLFVEGEELKGIYYIYEGDVKIHKRWGPDKELIVRFATDGEIVGHRGLGLDTLYPVSATAITAVTVCYFPIDFFMDTLKVNPAFSNDLLWFFAAELKASERKMHHLMLMPVKARLADTLLYLHHKFGTDENGAIKIAASKQDIASFAGTTYETSFRMYQEMQAQKLIEVTGKKIKLLDLKGLEDLRQPTHEIDS